MPIYVLVGRNDGQLYDSYGDCQVLCGGTDIEEAKRKQAEYTARRCWDNIELHECNGTDTKEIW